MQNSLSSTASVCALWEVTPLLGTPISSREKEKKSLLSSYKVVM